MKIDDIRTVATVAMWLMLMILTLTQRITIQAQKLIIEDVENMKIKIEKFNSFRQKWEEIDETKIKGSQYSSRTI